MSKESVRSALLEAFEALDRDNSRQGVLTRGEFVRLCYYLDSRLTEDVVEASLLAAGFSPDVFRMNPLDLVDWMFEGPPNSTATATSVAPAVQELPKSSLARAVGEVAIVLARTKYEAAAKAWTGPDLFSSPSGSAYQRLALKEDDHGTVIVGFEECYCHYYHKYSVECLADGRWQATMLEQGDECADLNFAPSSSGFTSVYGVDELLQLEKLGVGPPVAVASERQMSQEPSMAPKAAPEMPVRLEDLPPQTDGVSLEEATGSAAVARPEPKAVRSVDEQPTVDMTPALVEHGRQAQQSEALEKKGAPSAHELPPAVPAAPPMEQIIQAATRQSTNLIVPPPEKIAEAKIELKRGNTAPAKEAIASVFTGVGKLGCGSIKREKLQLLLSKLGGGKALTDEEVKRLLSRCRQNGDGTVNIREFLGMLVPAAR